MFKLEAEKLHVTSPKETIEAEVAAVKSRLWEFQLNRPNMLTSGPKVKAASFDGTVSFSYLSSSSKQQQIIGVLKTKLLHWSSCQRVPPPKYCRQFQKSIRVTMKI